MTGHSGVSVLSCFVFAVSSLLSDSSAWASDPERHALVEISYDPAPMIEIGAVREVALRDQFLLSVKYNGTPGSTRDDPNKTIFAVRQYLVTAELSYDRDNHQISSVNLKFIPYAFFWSDESLWGRIAGRAGFVPVEFRSDADLGVDGALSAGLARFDQTVGTSYMGPRLFSGRLFADVLGMVGAAQYLRMGDDEVKDRGLAPHLRWGASANAEFDAFHFLNLRVTFYGIEQDLVSRNAYFTDTFQRVSLAVIRRFEAYAERGKRRFELDSNLSDVVVDRSYDYTRFGIRIAF